MCELFGGGAKPPAIQAPAPLPAIPKETDPAVIQARQRRRTVAALSAGRDKTILTSAQGLLDEPSTTKKTVLG